MNAGVTRTAARESDSTHQKVHGLITDERTSRLRRYQRVIVGSTSLWYTLKFELACWGGALLPGAVGLWARRKLYQTVLREVGHGTLFGAHCILRHPGKITLGNNVVVSDGCTLDARGDDNEGIRVGNNVILGDRAMIRCKNADVTIGNNVGIGANADICPVDRSRIEIGDDVMLGPFVYLGGVQYAHQRLDVPMHEQGVQSKGGISIGAGSHLGAFVSVMDGVTIGTGCIVGTGAVVREHLPDYTIATPHQRLVLVSRRVQP